MRGRKEFNKRNMQGPSFVLAIKPHTLTIIQTAYLLSSLPAHLSPAQVGELVYAVVTRAHPHIEPEVSCVDGSGKSDGLGQLSTAGYLLKCSLGLCRK